MNNLKKINVGTRGSLLAVTQCKQVCDKIFNNSSEYDLKIIKTSGDIQQDKTFSQIAKQAIFTKELDDALLSSECDLAVHSFKDLTGEIHKDLEIVCLLNEVDSRDCFLSTLYTSLSDMPNGATVGTSSIRRYSILKQYFPHLKIKAIRGNIDSRINKMKKGSYDAIILAAAGLIRVSRESEIKSYLPLDCFTPPLGQGMIALVTRKNDPRILEYLNLDVKSDKQDMILGLRSVVSNYEGGCSLPMGISLENDAKGYFIRAYMGNAIDMSEIRCVQRISSYSDTEKIPFLQNQLDELGAKGMSHAMKGFVIA